MADDNPYLSLVSEKVQPSENPELEIPQGPNGSQPTFINPQQYQEEENPYMSAMQNPLPDHENFLQKAINGVQQYGRMATIGRDSFLNTATMGFPDALEKAIPLPDNIQTPLGSFDPNQEKPQNSGEGAVSNFGSLAGMFGGPGALGSTVEKGVAKALPEQVPNFLANIMSRGVGGASAGYTIPGNRPMNAAIGGIASPIIGGVVDGVKGFSDLINPKPVQSEIALNQESGGQLANEGDRLQNVGDYLKERGQREVGYVDSAQQEADKGFSNEADQLKNKQTKDKASFGYNAAKGIKTEVGEKFQAARDNYAQMLQETNPEKVGMDDLLKVVDKTIENKGILGKEFPDTADKAITQYRFKIAGKIPQAAEESIAIDPMTNQPVVGSAPPPEMTKLSDPVDLKNIKNEVFRLVQSRPDMEAEFLNNYDKMLKDKGITGFQDANAKYSQAYDAANTAKEFRQSLFEKIAGDKTVPEQNADLTAKEGKIGTQYTKKGLDLQETIKKQSADLEARRNTSQQDFEQKRGKVQQKYQGAEKNIAQRQSENDQAQGRTSDRISQLGNDLEKIMGRRNIAKGAAIGSTGATGLGILLKFIFGHHDN